MGENVKRVSEPCRIEVIFREEIAGVGAVRRTLQKYLALAHS